MNLNKKYLALLITAVLGLSGCVEDAPNTEEATGNSGEVSTDNGNNNSGNENNGNETSTDPQDAVLYGTGSDNNFVLQAADVSGTPVDVTKDSTAGLTDLEVSADVATEGAVSFNNKVDAAAELLLSSTSEYDFTNSKYNGKGVLEFDIQVNSFNKLTGGNVQPINVTLKSSDDKTSSVDISSAMSAFIGSGDFQKVRVPLSCFDNVDITKVNQPFSLQVVSGINYSVQDIKYIAEADGDKPGVNKLLECTNNSDVLKDATSILFSRYDKATGDAIDGWATKNPTDKDNGVFNARVPTLPTGYTSEPNQMNFSGAWANPKSYIAGSGVVPSISFSLQGSLDDMTTVPRKDLSQYMEKGELEFHLWVDKRGNVDTADNLKLQLQFMTPESGVTDAPTDGYSNSKVFEVDITAAKVDEMYKVNIPLTEFFVADDGSIDINTLQHVESLNVTPVATYTDPGTSADYYDLRYNFGDLQLVMNPAATGTGVLELIPAGDINPN